ncbi:hypothetical protein PPERSA_07263 [Pseudocohnilembus persalinus]|uniref:Uncharacterized protein n=1 Tax=Pseudocohnilembus persalinus TaxID=266149 RepID=A0A0V0QD02_PSEPJ|nr:hypothetical protein PPERSA_07263 [Pseudocohnilembus persalinus]|eukprot:KRX00066.1 hypothetical protein PPERSA_07263 [Pseudocohnilembus persalinus]
MNERVSLNYQIQGHLVPNITLNYNHILCQLNDVMENQIEQISEIYGFNMSYVTTENTSNFYCICEFQSDFADENIQTFVTLLEFQAIKKSQCKNSQVNLQKVQHSLQNLFRSEASQIVSIWGITQELENIKEEPLLTLKIHLTLFEENFFQTNEKQKTYEELSKYNYQQWQQIQDKNNLKQEINKFQHYTSINDKCKNEDQEHKQHKVCPNFIQLKNIISGHCPFPLEKYLNIEDKFKSQEELQNQNNDQQIIPDFKEFVLKNKNCNQSELNFLICKQIQELQSILVAQNKDACKHLEHCQQAINNNINPIALLNPLILIQNDIFPDNVIYQQQPQQQKHHQQQQQLQIQENDINLQQKVSQQPVQPQFFPNNKNQNQNQNHNPNRTQFQNQINSPLQFQLQQQQVQDLQQVEQQLSINQNEHNNDQLQQQEQFTEIQYPKTPNNSPVHSEHKERQNELNLENLQFNQHLAKLNSINKSFYEDDQFSATLFFNNQNPVSEILSPISNNLNSINQNCNFNYEKTQHLKNSFTQQLNTNSNNYNQFNQQQLQQQQYPINKGIKAFRKNSLHSPSIFEVSSQLLKQSKANRSYFRKKNSFQISQSLKLLDTPQLDLNFPQHKSSICTQNFELENNASNNNNNNEINNNNLQLNQENQINQEGFGEQQNKFLDDRFHLDQNFNNNQNTEENQKHNINQQQQFKNNNSNNHNNDNQIQEQQKQQNNFIQSNLDLQQNNFNNETNFYLDPPQSNEQIKLQKQQISDNNNLNNYDFIDFVEQVNNNNSNNNNNQQKYQIQQQEHQIQNQQYQQQQNKMDRSFSYDFQQQQQIQEDSFLTNNHNNEGKQNFYSNNFNQKNSSIQNSLNFSHRVQFENNQNQSNNFQKQSNNNLNNISTIQENQEFSSTTHSTNSLNNQNVSRNYPNNYNSDHNLSQMTNNQVRISNRKKNKSSSKSIAHSQKLLQQQQQSQSQEEINYQIQIYDQEIAECHKTQTHQYLKNLDHDEDQQKLLQQQHQFQQQCEQNKKIKI